MKERTRRISRRTLREEIKNSFRSTSVKGEWEGHREAEIKCGRTRKISRKTLRRRNQKFIRKDTMKVRSRRVDQEGEKEKNLKKDIEKKRSTIH